MFSIAVAGTDFHSLTLAELEQASARTGGTAGAVRLAERMRDEIGAQEVVALVTCNRIELFVSAERRLGTDELARAFEALTGVRGFAHVDGDAERHLLRVACSLESSVLGEDQILGQVRNAFAAARAAGSVGPRLTALFDLALRVGKRVRRETPLAHLGTDLARLALRHVKTELRAEAAGPLALLGTGAMARAVLGARPKDARTGWLLVGRDETRTAAVASEFGVAFQTLDAFLADRTPLRALIAATCTEQPLIGTEFVARRLGDGAGVVDLGLPRNVAPQVREHARLADLADLRELACENAGRLASTVAQIEGWIQEGLARRALRQGSPAGSTR